MSSISLVTLFLPPWALPWVMVLAAAAWITGARALAAAAATVVVADSLIAPLLVPVISSLPGWVFLPLLALLALTIVHRLVTLMFGPETAGNVTATLLLGGMRMLFWWPFRLIGYLIRLGGEARR